MYANCIQTGIKQHIEVLPRIESTSADSREVSPRDRKCINLRKQDKPCLPNSEAKGRKARVAIEFACKRISVSVNDRCKQEPDLNHKLVDEVLRCWQSSYAACVKCMYMQDEIPVNDSNSTRCAFSGIFGTSNSPYALRKKCR